MTLLVEATGPTPPDEVWDRYATPSRWSEWAPQIRSVTLPDPLKAGDRGWVHGPWPSRVPVRIRSVDESTMRWSWWVGLGPLGMPMDHGVDAEGDGSRAWARMYLPSWALAPYAPLARLALRRLVS